MPVIVIAFHTDYSDAITGMIWTYAARRGLVIARSPA